MKLSHSAIMVYCLAGKFRTQYLIDQNMGKVFEKNHHTFILALREPGFGFQNFSTVLDFKTLPLPQQNQNGRFKIGLENSIYFPLRFKFLPFFNWSNACLGFYMKNSVAFNQEH